MPKNQFQRAQPIIHTHNVPRHGVPQATPPQRPAGKAKPHADKSGLPSLEKLLQAEHRH